MTFWHALFTIVFWSAAPLAVLTGGLWLWIRHTDTGTAESFPEIMRVLGGNLVTGVYLVNQWLHEETALAPAPEPWWFFAEPLTRTDGNVWELLADNEHYPHSKVSHEKAVA